MARKWGSLASDCDRLWDELTAAAPTADADTAILSMADVEQRWAPVFQRKVELDKDVGSGTAEAQYRIARARSQTDRKRVADELRRVQLKWEEDDTPASGSAAPQDKAELGITAKEV
jgi:hypothetical protein